MTDVPDTDPGTSPSGADGEAAAASTQGDIGHALRSIYQQTVEEDVPDEMFGLLGRLG